MVRRRLEAYAVEARARSLLRRRASLPWIPSPPHPPSSPGTWSPAPPTLLLPGDFFPDYPSYLQASCSTSTASRVAITSSRAGPRAWWRAPRRPRWPSPSPPPRRQRRPLRALTDNCVRVAQITPHAPSVAYFSSHTFAAGPGSQNSRRTNLIYNGSGVSSRR